MAFDSDFASVSLLLHCDGANGSTTFTDHSSIAHTIVANGDARISTAQGQWGGASGIFEGTGDYLHIADHSSLKMGSGDFTIEWFVRYSSFTDYRTVIDKGYVSPNGFVLQTIINTGKLGVYISGSLAIEEASSPSLNTWYYYALVRSGSTLTLYRDSISVGSATDSTDLSITDIFRIGGGGGYYIDGYIDDIRITKGVARTISGIPAEAFPNAAGPSGIMSALESADIFTGTGVVPLTGTMSATESIDIFAGTGGVPTTGIMSALESADIFAGTGVMPLTGTMSATESIDIFSVEGILKLYAQLIVNSQLLLDVQFIADTQLLLDSQFIDRNNLLLDSQFVALTSINDYLDSSFIANNELHEYLDSSFIAKNELLNRDYLNVSFISLNEMIDKPTILRRIN